MITEEFLERLQDIFFIEDHFIFATEVRNWLRTKRRITTEEIANHFSGSYYIGFLLTKKTNVLCFDIDVRNKDDEMTLAKRCNSISLVYGYPNLITSTPRKGIHFYYFLNKEYKTASLKEYIPESITLKKRDIEIYPCKSGIRLFGGRDCHILDNKLQRLTIDPASYFSEVWENSERLDLSPFKRMNNCKKQYFTIDQIDAESLLKYGLSKESSRNDSLLQLNRYYRGHLDFSPDETELMLIDFIENKHNGFSKDWIKNPRMVKNQIKSMVLLYDDRKYSKTLEFPRHLLNRENKIAIMKLTEEISSILKTKKEKTYYFLVDLFSYFKQKSENYIAEIPRNVFQSCRNGSANRYSQYLHILLEMSVLSIAYNYSTELKRCRGYLLNDKYLDLIEEMNTY